MPYPRKLEHTSTSEQAKPGPQPTSTNPKRTNYLENPKKPSGAPPGEGREKTGYLTPKEDAGREANRLPALLAAALWYAGRGIPVFPLQWVDDQGRCSCGAECGSAGKHPRIPNGHVGASTDPGRIRRWWSRWPDANIGIPTGERSGLLVLDIDDHGFTSLAALEDEHGQLPETTTVRTGGGGMHVMFKYPASCGIRNSAGRVGLGLDVRGEGGYVVAPPSRTDKGPYAFLDKLPRADPPEWLLVAARGPYRAVRDEDGAAGAGPPRGLDGEPIPKGERGDTLFRIACSLRAKGCEYARILSEIRRVNRERCSPPIGAHPEDTDAKELEKIAESVVSRYPAGDASPEPPAEVLENVEALFSGVLERLEWTGRGGPTDRAVYAALLMTARRHGQPIRGGVKVYISVRALALAAGVSKPTVLNALDRLHAAKLVHRGAGGKGTKAGALVLKFPQALTTQPRGGGSEDSGQPLRDVMRELLRLRWGPGRAGKTCALYLDVIARSGEATLSEISERTGRRRDNVRRALVMAEAPPLVECSEETYRLVPDFRAALDNELEASGIKRSERLDRRKYEREREAYRERIARWRLRKPDVWPAYVPEPDGYIEDLESLDRVEASLEREIVQSAGKFAPGTLVTDVSDPNQFRELAHILRTGKTPLDAHRARRAVRRESRRLDRERGGYERRKDGAGVSPAAFLRSELRGVSGMGYPEMLRRWKALGGTAVTLEGAISAGPYRLKREPLDFNRTYVYPAVARATSRSEREPHESARNPLFCRLIKKLSGEGQNRTVFQSPIPPNV